LVKRARRQPPHDLQANAHRGDLPPRRAGAAERGVRRGGGVDGIDDPRSLLARELASLEQRERLAWQKLAGTSTGSKAWTAA
jgi:hypothetical protein